MGQVGSELTTLVILRGNAGSGKTTIARETRLRCGRGIAIVSQDVIRRDLLREQDVPGGVNIGLIDAIARHTLDEGYHVILEGVFHASHYGAMLGALRREHRGRTSCFYFDIPFEETLRRHASRPQSAEFGEAEMRSWYRPLDLVPWLEEHRIDAAHSLNEAIDVVMAESGIPRDTHSHDA
ncbi:MAG: kinase [Thermomicrobiales bacterium]